jgi:multicomponent Na+:H+ antiporter subunit B
MIDRSVILTTAVRYLLPLMLMFSIYTLLRGHNAPGGGFVGGLLAAAAFVLYGIGRGMDRARNLLRTEPQQLILLGLIMALVSAIMPMFFGGNLLEAIWLEMTLPAVGKLGTPLLFDLGVYFTVLGITMLIVLSLASLRETG